MKIIKYIKSLLVIFILFTSCKENKKTDLIKNNQSQINTKLTNKDTIQKKDNLKLIKNKFIQKLYVKKEINDNYINSFIFNDNTISLEYNGLNNIKLFGININNNFEIYQSEYDLDLGEVDLLRFDNNDDEYIYIVELNEYNFYIHYVYYISNNLIYYLGEISFELKEKDIKYLNNKKLNLDILRENNEMIFKIHLNTKRIKEQRLKINSYPLKYYNKYTDFKAYLNDSIK